LYRHVPRNEIRDRLIHLRGLYEQLVPTNEQELRAAERREIITKNLLSNLRRTSDDPTLNTVQEIVENFPLTIEGGHRFFGFGLEGVREYDLLLNGGRTHIVESYAFERDRLVDLPLELAPSATFAFDATLRSLVLRWQNDIPIRALDTVTWRRPGTFYVHVGTEDSLGAALPPGSTGLVEPIDIEEAQHPNPRFVYLLQFGNGYRCSRCVVSRGKLQLLLSARTDPELHEFAYPGSVRIAGRIRWFALAVPLPEYPGLHSLAISSRGADLILPWEHRRRDRLLASKHRRFQRSAHEEEFAREVLSTQLHSKLSDRTIRRYRRESASEPHVSSLIHMSIAHFARYTDTLRSGGYPIRDAGRYSLETLLNARHLEDLLASRKEVRPPTPSDVWAIWRREMVEWPASLSLKFPQLRLRDDRIVRLAGGTTLSGLDPAIGSGSWLLLESLSTIPDTASDRSKRGWSRPIYVLRRGLQFLCGYLERDGNRYALLASSSGGTAKVTFGHEELHELQRVSGVAVPV
jgi:hypothetical protein